MDISFYIRMSQLQLSLLSTSFLIGIISEFFSLHLRPRITLPFFATFTALSVSPIGETATDWFRS